jgi:hypothetical protein
LKKIIAKLTGKTSFKGSGSYWNERYSAGGNSGRGSYGHLATYKAAFLNSFVKQHQIKTVIEFGSGDGNQLTLAEYPFYTGLDVSPVAIQKCIALFKTDNTKSFFLYDSLAFADKQHFFKADLSLSLDVIYHLVEDEIYQTYMDQLFAAASKFVIIYAWDVAGNDKVHVKHRKFSSLIQERYPLWELMAINPGLEKLPDACDFFVYRRIEK